MSPIPDPPPVTTEVRLETLKRLEDLSSSFVLAAGLSEDMVLVTVTVEGASNALLAVLLAKPDEGRVKSLSIVVELSWGDEACNGRRGLLARHDVWADDDVEGHWNCSQGRRTARGRP